MTIIQRIISCNYSTGRGGNAICRITPHTPVGGAVSLFGWFNNPSAQASTHFYVNWKGEVEQLVRLENTAWANSNFGENQRAITYEVCDNGNPNDSVRNNEVYESSAQLMAQLSKDYNIPLVLVSKADATNWDVKGIDLHSYFANKSCPAGLDVMRIINRAKEILNINPTPVFDFKLDLSGKNTVLTITSGSVNADATVKNLNSGWIGTVHVNGGVGHTAVLNSDTGASLYEVSLNGVTHQLNNLPVVDYKTQLDILQGRFDILYAESQAKDGQISSLNASITDLNTKLDSSTKQVEDLLLKGKELDGQFSEYKTQSEADKKSLEESISLKGTSLQAAIGDNQRLQEELRVCQAGSMGGQTSTVAEAFQKLLNWITNLFKKN